MGNMGISYLVMLLTMTYQVELFIAVLLGLGLGHLIKKKNRLKIIMLCDLSKKK